MSGSSFIAGIHRFLRKSKTLSILTVPNLKIEKNKLEKISFGKALRGKILPKKTAKEGEVSFELDFEHRHTSGRLSLLFGDQIVKQGDDRKYFIIGN